MIDILLAVFIYRNYIIIFETMWQNHSLTTYYIVQTIEHAITIRQLRLLESSDLVELGFRMDERRAILNWISTSSTSLASDSASPSTGASPSSPSSSAASPSPAVRPGPLTPARPTIHCFKVCCCVSLLMLFLFVLSISFLSNYA